MVPRPDRRAARARALTEADALAVAASFGIDVAGASAAALSGGWSNEIVRVDARGGRYVVRRYGRLHVTREAIAFEHAIAAHAARTMPEIVAPLRDADGRTIATAPDGGMVGVFPYVEGTTGANDLRTARAAARVLARFHRAMHDVHVASGMRSTRFLGILPWLRERFARFAGDPLVARAIDWSELITAVSAAAVRAAAHAAALPHVVVHGDPNPANFVSAEPGAIRALIDFDFAHETERVYDLGVFLDEFARDGFAARLDVARVAPLLAAYAEAAPLSASERELVPEAMVRHAATLVWYVVTRHGERVPGDVGGAPVYAARVREIAAHADAIREAARG
ncbi:MAG TPA: phosphotransferase [Candidatus Limnocylindrales bacterium]|nr:phosphotransferase [Candidatus Limnocylindrales bacterium]